MGRKKIKVEDKKIRMSITVNPKIDLIVKEKHINLLKIESRPQKDTNEFKFWFFIDIEGNVLDSSIETILKAQEEEIKFLGSYMNLC